MFKILVKTILLRRQQTKCYKAMRNVGRANYCTCLGHYDTKNNTPYKACLECPHFFTN